MFSFFRKGAVVAVENELKALEARRASLSTKLTAAELALDAARNTRREHLIDGAEDDNASAQKIEKTIIGAEREAASLADAIAEVDRRLVDGRNRLATENNAELREKVAAERETAAKQVQTVSARLEKVIADVALVFDALTEVIPHGAAQIYEPGVGPRPASPHEAARAILAEGLFSASPEMFEVIGRASISETTSVNLQVMHRRREGSLDGRIPKGDTSVEFLPATQAANAILVEPLRRSAEAIRAGDAPADSDVTPLRVPAPVEPGWFEFKDVYLLRPISFIGCGGYRMAEDLGYHVLDAPVAEKALALGAAVTPDDPRADEHRAAMHRNPYETRAGIGPTLDLGVDLKKLREAERARLNRPTPRLAAE